MNQRCWAPSAAWVALDAASAPARESTPCAGGSAWPRAVPASRGGGGKRGGAQTVRQGRARVLGRGVTGQGGAAERLNGVGCGRARLVPVWVDRAPGLGTAVLGVDQHPAGRHFPSG